MTFRVNRSLALLTAAATVTLALGATMAPEARAQGWWPWANNDSAPPRPREPVYRGPPPAPIPGAPIPAQPAPGVRPQGQAGNICLQLEQQLVSEGQRGGANPRDTMARLETDIRLLERQQSQAQSQLETGNCYEYFLFSKSLKNTPTCRNAANSAEQLRNRIRDLDTQRGQMAGKSDRSVRDDVIRELARNGCGQRYADEARRLDSKGFGLWSTEEDGGHKGNQFGSLPFATYRTICVRLCDGYYFPVSFSTLPNHFQRDQDACQSKCAAPVELYYHQNPGAGVDQAVSAKANSNYTALKTAFRYRKEYVHGCSCKEAEYQPGAGERRADAPGAAARVPAKAP
jgi:Protein of unknown function (DUF2865)